MCPKLKITLFGPSRSLPGVCSRLEDGIFGQGRIKEAYQRTKLYCVQFLVPILVIDELPTWLLWYRYVLCQAEAN